MITIARVTYLVVLLAAVPAHAIDRWAAFHGDFCCGIPERLLKYMDADTACKTEAPAPVGSACRTTLSATRSAGGPNPPTGFSSCVYDWVCNCGDCLIGAPGNPANVHIGTYAGANAHKGPPPPPCAPAFPDFLSCTFAKAKGKGNCDLCQGNPVNFASGNKFQRETLYRSGSGTLDVELWYNSQGGVHYFEAGAFGAKWTSRYFVMVKDTGQGVVAVNRPDGKEIEFRAPPSGTSYLKDADVNDTLERLIGAGGVTAGWRVVDSRTDEIEQFDASGRLLSVRDRAGRQTTMTYAMAPTPPAATLLVAVNDHFGRQLGFTYDAQRRVASLVDPAGGETLFQYDSANNLVKVTFPDTSFRTYHYAEPAYVNGGAACASPAANLPHALTGVTDENGARYSTWTYNCDGRAASSELAGGVNRFTFIYDAGLRGYVTPLNATHSMAATSILGTVKSLGITRPSATGSGTVVDLPAYDANGNTTSWTDYNGNRTAYTYDLTRNLEISRTEAIGTPLARMISTQWHPAFRLPTTIAEPLRITTNTYDVTGNLLAKSVQPTSDASGVLGLAAAASGAPRTWTYTYNANGSVLTADGPRADASDITTYTYYPNDDAVPGKRGNVATITNALGHATSITAYNAHGQPLAIVDPNGLTTAMAYDGRQRLASRTVGSEVTSYTYDGVGQLVRVTLPDGSFLEYSYDAARRLTGIADNLGNRIAYTLDAMGNRTQEQVLDPSGALAQMRGRVFNSLNRLFQELGAQGQVTEYGYDQQGNVTSVKDPLNRVTANQYDALNRLRQVTDPGLGVTQYAYNGLDALTSVSDPRSLVTGYSVDGLGNLTQQVSPDTGTTTNTYDAAGSLLTQTDAKGQVTTYAYDALNRVTLITFHDGSKQQYAYDSGANAIGRLSSITELDPASQQANKTSYAYDQHGRVLVIGTEHAGVVYNVGYTYDSAGRLSGVTYPSGRTVAYGFDSLGRVSAISTTKDGQTLAIVSGVAYHPFGGVKSYTLGNGQAYTRGIDLDGRVASYSLGSQAFGIGYDAASRITFITDLANPASSNTYSYDAVDRLTGAVLPGTPFAYSYDAVGNRTSKTVGAATEAYTYSPTSNRIATAGARSFMFDANGSTTADGASTFSYDARGRMVQASSALGASSYQLNALGQRIRKTNSLGDTVFHYDTFGRLIAESDAAGAWKREMLYLGDIPVAVVQ